MSDGPLAADREWVRRHWPTAMDWLSSWRGVGVTVCGLGRRVWVWERKPYSDVPRWVGECDTGGLTGVALLASLQEAVTEMLRKQDRPQAATTLEASPADEAFQAAYPTLWSHLTQTRWDDGSARQTSSVLLFRQDGAFKIMLRDADAGLCLWLAVQRPIDLFEALEAALRNPQADWRTDRRSEGQQAKRTKRPGS